MEYGSDISSTVVKYVNRTHVQESPIRKDMANKNLVPEKKNMDNLLT